MKAGKSFHNRAALTELINYFDEFIYLLRIDTLLKILNL